MRWVTPTAADFCRIRSHDRGLFSRGYAMAWGMAATVCQHVVLGKYLFAISRFHVFAADRDSVRSDGAWRLFLKASPNAACGGCSATRSYRGAAVYDCCRGPFVRAPHFRQPPRERELYILVCGEGREPLIDNSLLSFSTIA